MRIVLFVLWGDEESRKDVYREKKLVYREEERNISRERERYVANYKY